MSQNFNAWGAFWAKSNDTLDESVCAGQYTLGIPPSLQQYPLCKGDALQGDALFEPHCLIAFHLLRDLSMYAAECDVRCKSLNVALFSTNKQFTSFFNEKSKLPTYLTDAIRPFKSVKAVFAEFEDVQTLIKCTDNATAIGILERYITDQSSDA